MASSADTDRSLFAAAGLEVSERAEPDGGTSFFIKGDTHPHRRLLRELGGRWDKLRFGWVFAGADPRPAIAQALRGRARQPGLAEDAGESEFEGRANRPHYWGHRQRLRERFLAGPDTLPDYELLEILLFFSIPRVDVKPLAKDLIARFGSLAGVLSASPEQLAEFEAVTHQTIVSLKAIKEASVRLARAEVISRPVISSWDKLLDYCRASMGLEPVEHFRLLFLDRKNKLIADELQQKGTVDHTPLYPREVVKRALELHASAIILVHNHPSGDPTPSAGDIAMTREVREACEKLGIALHDHVVIAKGAYASFKSLGLI